MNNPTAICGTCDAVYDPTDPEEARIHAHMEPQSGAPRDHLLEFCRGGKTYEQWIVETSEGRAWVRYLDASLEERRKKRPLDEGFYEILVRDEETRSSLALVPATSIDTPPLKPVHVTAENPSQMAQCQNSLIEWATRKVETTRDEASELREAFEHAKKRKWKSDTLRRHFKLAERRVVFYEKLKAALEAGYQIVPPFPCTIFAVRTDRESPAPKKSIYHYANSHQQDPQELPVGEGQYQNPFPLVLSRQSDGPNNTKVTQHWADGWADFEFPVSMAKLNIIQATERAMALRIFDSLGLCPPDRRKADPMIVAQIQRTEGYIVKTVNFIVAWHLNTKDL